MPLLIAGSGLEATITSVTTPTLSLNIETTNTSSLSFSSDTLLILLYTLQVTADSSPHSISCEVLLGQSVTELSRGISVMTPDLVVSTEGGNRGGYIPGDTATLAIIVQVGNSTLLEVET